MGKCKDCTWWKKGILKSSYRRCEDLKRTDKTGLEYRTFVFAPNFGCIHFGRRENEKA